MFDHIYIIYDDFEMFFAPALVAEYNFDPQKGQLFCRYEAVLDQDMLNDCTINDVGVTIGQSMASHMSAGMAQYKKGKGSLIISVNLRLNQGQNCSFLAQENGEENALARNILSGIYSWAGYELAVADDFLPIESIHFDQSKLTERKEATASTMGGSLIISSQAFSVPVKELVVFFEGKPVLRTLASPPENVKMSSVTANSAGSVVLNESYIQDIFDVTINSASNANFFALPCSDSLSFLGESGYKIDDDSILKSGINQLGIKCDQHGITLTEALMPLKWHDGFDASLVANGGLVVFGKKITIYDENGTHELNIKPAVKNEAIFSGGVYLIACTEGQSLTIHRVNSTANYAVSSTTTSGVSELALVPIFDRYIAAISTSFCSVYDVVGTQTGLTSWLNSIKSYFVIGQNPTFSAGRLVFFDGSNSRWFDFMGTQQQNILGRIFDDFVISFDGTHSLIYRLDEPSKVLAKIEGQIKSIARNGDRLHMVVQNGRLLTYLIGSKRTRLHCEAITPTSRVNYFVRYSLPDAGSATITLSIN